MTRSEQPVNVATAWKPSERPDSLLENHRFAS